MKKARLIFYQIYKYGKIEDLKKCYINKRTFVIVNSRLRNKKRYLALKKLNLYQKTLSANIGNSLSVYVLQLLCLKSLKDYPLLETKND